MAALAACDAPPKGLYSRSPGGFEGLGLVDVEADRHRTAFAHRPDHRGIASHLQSAAPPAAMGMQKDYDLVGGSEEAQRLPAEPLPNFVHLAIEASNALVTAVRLGVEDSGGHVELKVAVTKRDQPVDVPVVQMLERQPHGLDVLPRHRLLPA